MPDPLPAGASRLPPAGWSGRERLAIAAVLAALALLVGVRAGTRRADAARSPLDLDVLVIHAAGLRADAATAEALAADLSFDPADMARFSQAYAQSIDAVRSARSALDGDLARDLRAPASPLSLPARLGERGWRTILLDDAGGLAELVGASFARVERLPDAEAAPAALAATWAERQTPAFAFVHLAFGGEPLHSDTTEAYVLEERYRLRLKRIRQVVRAVAVAARSPRPQLVVLLGATGLQLGEHPAATELPWEERVRVPMLVGLRGAGGLPTGSFSAAVQSADLAPTILDVLDLRAHDERAGDGVARAGISLEPYLHGWSRGPVHPSVVLFGVEHVAVRTEGWKLIAPIDPPLRPVAEGARLFSLAEDPQEHRDLLLDRPFGPVADELFAVLTDRFGAAPAPGAAP